jgi:hypothetical protein
MKNQMVNVESSNAESGGTYKLPLCFKGLSEHRERRHSNTLNTERYNQTRLYDNRRQLSRSTFQNTRFRGPGHGNHSRYEAEIITVTEYSQAGHTQRKPVVRNWLHEIVHQNNFLLNNTQSFSLWSRCRYSSGLWLWETYYLRFQGLRWQRSWQN